jgi:CRP-like cAMP-binding protein
MPFRLVPQRDRSLFRLVKQAEAVHLVKGRALYRSGDPAREVFLVQSGFVRLNLPGMEERSPERTVAVALPWEMFGDDAFTDDLRRYGAVAGSRCTVLPLPKAAVLRGLKTAKSSLEAYLSGSQRELHRLRHQRGGSRGPTTAQRLAEVLIEIGARCGEPSGRGVRIGVRLTHHVLADLAGAHRATITTLLNDWLYRGILATDAQHHLELRRPSDLWVAAGYYGPARPGS